MNECIMRTIKRRQGAVVSRVAWAGINPLKRLMVLYYQADTVQSTCMFFGSRGPSSSFDAPEIRLSWPATAMPSVRRLSSYLDRAIFSLP